MHLSYALVLLAVAASAAPAEQPRGFKFPHTGQIPSNLGSRQSPAGGANSGISPSPAGSGNSNQGLPPTTGGNSNQGPRPPAGGANTAGLRGRAPERSGDASSDPQRRRTAGDVDWMKVKWPTVWGRGDGATSPGNMELEARQATTAVRGGASPTTAGGGAGGGFAVPTTAVY